MRKFWSTLLVITMISLSGAAWAIPGDCDGNGVVEDADADALMANLNTEVGSSSLANCDYNNDGGLGLDDMGSHLKNSQ